MPQIARGPPLNGWPAEGRGPASGRARARPKAPAPFRTVTEFGHVPGRKCPCQVEPIVTPKKGTRTVAAPQANQGLAACLGSCLGSLTGSFRWCSRKIHALPGRNKLALLKNAAQPVTEFW